MLKSKIIREKPCNLCSTVHSKLFSWNCCLMRQYISSTMMNIWHFSFFREINYCRQSATSRRAELKLGQIKFRRIDKSFVKKDGIIHKIVVRSSLRRKLKRFRFGRRDLSCPLPKFYCASSTQLSQTLLRTAKGGSENGLKICPPCILVRLPQIYKYGNIISI